MEIPGGSQGSLEQDALFLSPFFPVPPFHQQWVGVSQRLEEESKPPLWAESQKDQVWRDGCRAGGERDQAAPGEVGSYVGQGGRKGKVEGIARPGQGPKEWA